MTRDDITNMARDAGFDLTIFQLSFGYEICGTHKEFEQFADLVVAAEREACAKVCDDLVLAHPGRADLTAQQCALAIRERGAP
jgi:hypothetical protein